VIGHLRWAGETLRAGVSAAAQQWGVGEHFQVLGHPANLIYATKDDDGRPSQSFRTLFLQETIRRGVLAPSLVVSYAHGEEEISRTIEAVSGALEIYRRALEDGVEHHLVGRPVQPVFRRQS